MSASVSTSPSLLRSGEKLFSPAAIAKQIPSHRDKAHLNGSTIFRWITRGVRTPAGDVIKLEGVKVGCFWRTSLEAVDRFTAKLTEASTDQATAHTPQPPSPKQRQRAAEKASAKLDTMLGTSAA